MSRLEPKATDLSAALDQATVLVTTGAGGVGKTTTAAAIGVAAAERGRKVLVMTIDPARRLAQSMGLESLTHELQRVPLTTGQPGGSGGGGAPPGDKRTRSGRGTPAEPDEVGDEQQGELWASMLDMQTTFDQLIDRHASSPQAAANIKGNRIYQTLSSTLSGTQEYMAMERLYELHSSGRWDLVVVDTPPTRSALDFLDAPQRMTSFLDGKLLRALLKPAMATGKGYLKVVGFGANAFMKVAGKVTGMELLNDLADFFRNFEGMYEGFKERADAVLELLQQPDSRFVIVTSPEPPPLAEAKFFLERMEQEGLHAAGVVVNRIHPEVHGAASDEDLRHAARRLRDEHPDVAGMVEVLADVRGIAERERREVESALYGRRLTALVEVPLLRGDVHDLDTLHTIADTLAGDGPDPVRTA